MRRILEECGAPLLFAENVQGHVSLGLDIVYRDLQTMGFKVEAGIFSAAEVGATHVRKRLFILAYTDIAFIRNMAEPFFERRQAAHGQGGLSIGYPPGRGDLDASLPDGYGAEPGLFPPDAGEFEAWDAWNAAWPGLQPALAGTDDGLANKLERYKLTGNGVVPLAAGYALATLSALALRRN